MKVGDKRPWYIYGLTDPRTRKVRYVGKAVDVQRRYRRHLRSAKAGGTHKECWLYALQQQGLKPGLTILQKTKSQAAANRAEIRWIAKLPNLTNISAGGEGFAGLPSTVKRGRKPGYHHSEESKQQRREFNRQHGIRPPHPSTFSVETKAKVVAGLRRYWEEEATEDAKATRSAKHSANAKQQWTDPIIRKKMVEAMSRGQRRRFATSPHPRKGKKGKPLSKAHRQALARGNARRWAAYRKAKAAAG